MDTTVAGPPAAFTPPKISPVEGPLSTLGLLRVVVRNPVASVPKAAYEEACIRTTLRGRDVYSLMAPDLVETVLVHRHEAFSKSPIDARIFEPVVGRSLLTAEGQDWRWQRRLAAPAFRQTALATYLPVMRQPFEALASRWASAPGPHEVDEAVRRATLNVICGAFFSDFSQPDARRVSQLVARYVAPVPWIIAYVLLGLPSFVPHPGKLRMRRAAAEGRDLIRSFIASRRGKRLDSPDLAQVLIEAEDPETGRALSDQDLLDMFMTLLAAGHETSANALIWALYCLAAQPDRQDTLSSQVRAVVGEGPVEMAHLEALGDVRCFLEETMRLFPPVPRLARLALRDCQIGGELIRTGSLVFIPIYTIHRHRTLWEEPDVFDPARFQDAATRLRPRCAFLPFGAGPRICIGAGFALMEMIVGLATLLNHVTVRLGSSVPPQPIHRITLRPEGPLVLRFEPRS
ncbi:cytochrome P450 [Rubellimicrobium roseum]|uniref:Cytochrome P450 n=1 Tax=Rubellimicrobium roseum TaxID=687525 RepID=A0A5C4N913_9RHOB|nr:cytochrome P450 [Rubellimicrobium roseum]TNC59325.1 cytochrome P450 [Rubellimicrobium roseum]